MSSTSQVEEIEVSMQQAREQIDFTNALIRLRSNPDFIKVIEEGYFKEEAIRLVYMKSEPAASMQTEQMQKMIDRDIYGIGSLMNFFNRHFRSGEMAQNIVEQGNQEIDYINENDADE